MAHPSGTRNSGVASARFWREAASDVRTVASGWRWGVGRHALVPRSAEPHVPPRSTRVFPTEWARTRTANSARELLLGVGMHWLLRSQVSVRVEGADRVESLRGPVVFAANHSSHIDTPLILTSLPPQRRRRTAVAAAADYFFDTWWRASASALLFNTFPIERRGGTMATTPTELLADGWSVVVFPEGSRTPDGAVRPFKAGAAFMALAAGVPVVPVAIGGAFNAMPRGRSWPYPGRPPLSIRYGDPLHALEGEGPRDLNRRIQAAVAELLDEGATDWYSARRRAIAAAAEPPRPAAPAPARWRVVWDATTGEPAATRPDRGRARVWR